MERFDDEFNGWYYNIVNCKTNVNDNDQKLYFKTEAKYLYDKYSIIYYEVRRRYGWVDLEKLLIDSPVKYTQFQVSEIEFLNYVILVKELFL